MGNTGKSCSLTQGGDPLKGCPADVRMIAWIRRRNGPDCDFGTVFEEIFGCRDAVTESRFRKVLKERGVDFDIPAAFNKVCCYGSANGSVGAEEFELWQNEVEEKESEGVKVLRDFLQLHFTSPADAFKQMGKGEGEVLTQEEFGRALDKVGFKNTNPDNLFHCIDKDYSGEVSFAEFKAIMKATGPRKAASAPASPTQTDLPEVTRTKKRIKSAGKSPTPSDLPQVTRSEKRKKSAGKSPGSPSAKTKGQKT